MKTSNLLDQDMEEVINLLKKVMPKRLQSKEIVLSSNLKNDLHIDSLGLAELMVLIDQELGVDLFGKNLNISTVESMINEIIKLKK